MRNASFYDHISNRGILACQSKSDQLKSEYRGEVAIHRRRNFVYRWDHFSGNHIFIHERQNFSQSIVYPDSACMDLVRRNFGIHLFNIKRAIIPQIGAIQTVILPVLGQIVMGTIIDMFGWFGAKQLPMTWIKFIGIIIMVVGIFIAVVVPSIKNRDVRQFDSETVSGQHPTVVLGWQIWAVVIGFVAATQQAINGHLGTLLGSPSQASFVSFAVVTVIVILVALAVDKRLPNIQQLKETKAWNWLGGILGSLFVLASVITIPKIGAGLTIMMGLLGQIFGSILIQQFGWWKSMKSRVVLAQIVGMIIMLMGLF